MAGKKTIFVLLFLSLAGAAVAAESWRGPRTTVREYEQVFTTYPYSDPDPVPAMSRYYPYFRYDGFTSQPIKKKWKVVELSNDYIQLLILPEIGGKIWAAIEKKSGRSFIYYNHVVKFRDISMRGPWTSGGMELNYGVMGHTPNCFSPVDYMTRQNPDGSASCIIGALDLLTRTSWRLEINLPANQADFTTGSFWHNSSGAEQPYYSWMNVGIKATDDLRFINPGTHYLGHDGRVFDWPVNPENGHDISAYAQNNFGDYKSYHVFGRLSEFFGGYYDNEDFGVAHYSPYGDKPGKKIWIWGLSRQGMIWENLLTDTDGQYVEIQSGRLFNQTAEASTYTPFKHKDFPPYATDTWKEYWQPVKGTKGFVVASPVGAMNVSRESNQVVIQISPAQAMHEKLEVFDGETLLWSRLVALKPMQPLEKIVPLAAAPKALRVCLGGDKLTYAAVPDDELSRPTEAPANFDWDSDYGLYLSGKENCRERLYLQAKTNFEACLKTNPSFAPAMVELAVLANRRADFGVARDYARQALSIDTYDPNANFQFGVASVGLGLAADAKDAFSIGALSVTWRSAADTELAKEYLREKHYDRALTSAEAGLDNDRHNLDAIQIEACVARLRGDERAAETACQELLAFDPLSHFARFEKFLRGKSTRAEFTGQIRNELPHETYLELAAWYRNVGLDQDAVSVLELAPPTAEVLYWLAYLHRDTNLLARAEAASPEFVFPFRSESIPVFEWARKASPAWQSRYFLALIYWSQGNVAQAQGLLKACGDQPRFAPFYAARAQLISVNPVPDLETAAQLDPGQWRYGSTLAKYYIAKNQPEAALPIAERYAQHFPSNNVVALLYAKALALNGRFQDAATYLDALNVLPCEGSTDARSVLREAELMLATEQMKAGHYNKALELIAKAREWPENLGAGKPYPEDLDERLEDWLAYRYYKKSAATEPARAALQKILAFTKHPKPGGSGAFIRILALKESGRTVESEQSFKEWQEHTSDAALVTWASGAFAGQGPELPTTAADSGYRILAASLR